MTDETILDELTRMLNEFDDHDDQCRAQLFELLYGQLHKAAAQEMRRQSPAHSFWATDLVHETYVKLFGRGGARWQHRRHFLGVAVKAMRRILIDRARARATQRRKPTGTRVPIDGLVDSIADAAGSDYSALDAGLTQLERVDARAAEVVGLRFLAQLDTHEVADVLGICPRSVERDWAFARLWLRRHLK